MPNRGKWSNSNFILNQTNGGTRTTFSAAAGASVPTAKEWAHVLQRMGVAYLLEPYANSELKRPVKTPKLYFCDTGLRAHLSMWTGRGPLRQGAVSGRCYENHVVAELVNRYAGAPEPAALSFYRDKRGREVDIVVETGGELHPLEVKKSASPGRSEVDRFKALDVPGVQVGSGGVVCMCDRPYPIDARNSFIPSNLL